MTMGADRTITLSREVTTEEFEAILHSAHISFYRKNVGFWKPDYRQWETTMDVDIEGTKLNLHYAYWSMSHGEEAEKETERLIRYLKRAKLIKNVGRWRY